MIKFSIHQPMKSGIDEQSSRKYKKIVGKQGTWFIALNQENTGDNIYFTNYDPKSQGFAGQTLFFELEDGSVEEVKGPWHSNSEALFADTGYDVRDKYFTRGIIAKKVEYDKKDYTPIYTEVLHYDHAPVLGKFDRIEQLAGQLAKEHGKVYYAKVSNGGGSSGCKEKE